MRVFLCLYDWICVCQCVCHLSRCVCVCVCIRVHACLCLLPVVPSSDPAIRTVTHFISPWSASHLSDGSLTALPPSRPSRLIWRTAASLGNSNRYITLNIKMYHLLVFLIAKLHEKIHLTSFYLSVCMRQQGSISVEGTQGYWSIPVTKQLLHQVLRFQKFCLFNL